MIAPASCKTENWWKLSCQERHTVTNKKFENSGFFIKFRCNEVHQFILVLAWKMKLMMKYCIANMHETFITSIFSPEFSIKFLLVYALAYKTLSKTAFWSKLNRSAIALSLSGRLIHWLRNLEIYTIFITHFKHLHFKPCL